MQDDIWSRHRVTSRDVKHSYVGSGVAMDFQVGGRSHDLKKLPIPKILFILALLLLNFVDIQTAHI